MQRAKWMFPTTLLLVLVLPMGTSMCRGENWPGWRGPKGNGVSDETGLPVEWSDSSGIQWKTALPGMGVSTPVVWEDRVFVTSSSGHKQGELHFICLDRRDGSLRWERTFFGTAPTRYFAGRSSMATPTPVTDGENVWAFFGSGDLFCLDMHGGLVWTRSLVQEYERFQNRFGMAGSPLLVGDLVVLQCDHWGQSYLIAINKKTGKNAWRTDRSENLSWTTPLLTGVAGRAELIVCGTYRVRSYDPATGRELWVVSGLTRDMVPTPVAEDGLILVTSGPGGKSLAIRAGGAGDITESHVQWSNPRGAPFVPSPVLLNGRYYLVHDKGIVTCLDAQTGKRIRQRRIGEAFTASPVAGDGKLYVTDEQGVTTVLSTTADLNVLSRNELEEPVLSSAAISGGRIFMRAMSNLYCIDGQGSRR